ncbi:MULTISPECIES: MBL fold metallo-hydrolase [unclassified Streptomyces]|uniref:MBL fold metallo-hydrolase n=1 Tax=unclassified Streptomyces TaxID=2593676 RepID=UPI002E2E793F|nr:MBL fold metallo-hydrolase [Streptomyces sp. NBC_00441]
MTDGLLAEIADGVHAHVQGDGGWCLNNSGLLADGGESALVDTVATLDRARALRARVLAVTAGPPRYLVNTHFHGDHTFGNCVFPEAVVVGHARARDEAAAAGLHLTGLWPEVRWGDLEVVVPQVTFEERMTLYVGELRAELLHVGPAHTCGDTVVWLPGPRVLFAGDVVMNGVTPFCPMGSVSGSLRALAGLRALEPLTVVPGHGPVGGPELLDADAGYFRRLQELAREGVAAGLTPYDAAREAGPGPYAGLLDSERLVPNLHRAYAEERGALPGAPLDIGALFQEMARYHGGLPVCRA